MPGVRRPGWNRADHSLLLKPYRYLTDPHAFGEDRPVRFVIPTGGDERSMRVARVQHGLVVRWRQLPDQPSQSSLGRLYGLSKETVSRTVLGQRWMGDLMSAALLEASGLLD